MKEKLLMMMKDHLTVHSLLTTSPNDLHKSTEYFPKHLDVIIILHPSASIPDGPEPPFALISAFCI